jgi:hypothetical protein
MLITWSAIFPNSSIRTSSRRLLPSSAFADATTSRFPTMQLTACPFFCQALSLPPKETALNSGHQRNPFAAGERFLAPC